MEAQLKPTEREAILQLCREHCHPGANPGAHALAAKILVLLGERKLTEERK